MRQRTNINLQAGVSLMELMISVVISGIVLTSAYNLWFVNQKESGRIQNKIDLRNNLTLANNRLNKSITMAGFGMDRMQTLARATGDSITDTLKVYSNPTEFSTTLWDTAFVSATSIKVFSDMGFAVDAYVGLSDSVYQEYHKVTAISGDSANGFTINLNGAIGNQFNAGVPDVYPVKFEIYYADAIEKKLIHLVNGEQTTLGDGLKSFHIQFKDNSGNTAATYGQIKMVTYTLTGIPSAAQTNSDITLSSTVIPRNML